MIIKSSTTNLLLSSLSGLNKNQEVLSSNISNGDTPGYKAKKFDFETYIRNSQPEVYEKKKKEFFEYNLAGDTTNTKHFDIDEEFELNMFSMNINETDDYIMQNDKNNVDLERENVKMSQNQMLTSAVLGIYKKESMLFKAAIENSSRLN